MNFKVFFGVFGSACAVIAAIIVMVYCLQNAVVRAKEEIKQKAMDQITQFCNQPIHSIKSIVEHENEFIGTCLDGRVMTVQK